ncbi:hypothetical protein DA2_0402 [Desulfovibrio sp. A2]|nr:hypothetical protein DA2_0402 [Desulfovibrio sp. A2]
MVPVSCVPNLKSSRIRFCGAYRVWMDSSPHFEKTGRKSGGFEA